MTRITFFIAEALRAMRRNAAPSVAAVVTIIVTTLLLGVLVPVLWASASKNSEVRNQIEQRVFLYDDASKSEIFGPGGSPSKPTGGLARQLKQLPHVTAVQYVDKKEALKILRTRVKGDLKNSISQLKDNPLPRSFNVKVDDANNLEAVRQEIVPPGSAGQPKPISPAIQEVTDSRQQAATIRRVTSAVEIVLGVIAALLLIASLLLVANTIRLSIYARRREVEVMRLVGATNWFIRWPFVLEGLIVGLLGAGVAVGILWIGKVTIADPLSENLDLVANLQTMGFAPLVAILAGAAMAVSALGSGVTLRRFLRI
jgi:cell division transport system permease protein